MRWSGKSLVVAALMSATAVWPATTVDAGSDAIRARTIVDAAKYPWSAIGRVNFAGYRTKIHCTGAMISERLVLTAAHCLYNRAKKTWLRAQNIHFVAGYQRGDQVDSSPAIRYIVSSAHDITSRIHRSNPGNDWALIELQKPIGLRTGYLGWAVLDKAGLEEVLQAGGKIAIAGYPNIRKHVMSMDMECGRPGFLVKYGVLTHRCALMAGDSGGPVLLLEDGKATIIAINVGNTVRPKIAVSVATPLKKFYKTILKASGSKAVLATTDKRFGIPGQPPVR